MSNLIQRVPVDDERCVSFNLTLIHLTGKKANRFRQKQARKAARCSSVKAALGIFAVEA